MFEAAPLLLEFGSRSGSLFALGFFAAVFAFLGLAAAREIRQRSRSGRGRLAAAVGLLLFVAPLSLVYVSSLSGFYEAEIDGKALRLRYLTPGVSDEIALTEIASVATIPWYRGRSILRITDTAGRRYESATGPREAIATAGDRLLERLPPRGG